MSVREVLKTHSSSGYGDLLSYAEEDRHLSDVLHDDWGKGDLADLAVDLIRAGLALEQAEGGGVDFVANLINQEKSRGDGYTHAARWWALREELKAQYRQEARDRIARWVRDERTTEEGVDRRVGTE